MFAIVGGNGAFLTGNRLLLVALHDGSPLDCSPNCIALRISASCSSIERCAASVTRLYSGEFSLCVSCARLGVLPALWWSVIDDDTEDVDGSTGCGGNGGGGGAAGDKILYSWSGCGICFNLSVAGNVDRLIGGGGGLTEGLSMLTPRLYGRDEDGFCFGSGGSGLFGLNGAIVAVATKEGAASGTCSTGDGSLGFDCTIGIRDESCLMRVI